MESALAALLPYKGKLQKFRHSLGILCKQKTNFELKFIGPDFLYVVNIIFFTKKCPKFNCMQEKKSPVEAEVR